MSFGYFSNNQAIAVRNGITVDSSFDMTYPDSAQPSGFLLNGVDICNYITPYLTGYSTNINYGFNVNGININQKFSYKKPLLTISHTAESASDATYKYFIFKTTTVGGALTITVPDFQLIKNKLNTNPIAIKMLLVGGGGSGAQTTSGYSIYPGAGGGGAGSYVTIEFDINGSRFNNNEIKFSPTIGEGGAVTGNQSPGKPGKISSVSIKLNTTHTVSAGGGGGGYQIHARIGSIKDSEYANSTLAGSSGGATSTTLEAGNSYNPVVVTPNGATVVPASSIMTIVASQNRGGGAGNNGVVAVSGSHFQSSGGGGGGGAGAEGSSTPDFWSGGAGGVGKQWIDGKYYAGGGGGANTSGGGTIGPGGSGGGGGTQVVGGYGNGAAHTGGGGSGGWAGSVTTGGSGVCIIAMLLTDYSKYFERPVKHVATGNFTFSSNANYDNIVTFVGNGTIRFTEVPTSNIVLLVGGGGTPSKYTPGSGGGGGGAVGIGPLTLNTSDTYTITIGNGGNDGENGADSTITVNSTIRERANGGGKNNTDGGSGGGGGPNTGTGANATTGTGTLTYYGNKGGSYFTQNGVGIGGGGGGAGGVGGTGSSYYRVTGMFQGNYEAVGGTGGAGKLFTGTNKIYGAGGNGHKDWGISISQNTGNGGNSEDSGADGKLGAKGVCIICYN